MSVLTCFAINNNWSDSVNGINFIKRCQKQLTLKPKAPIARINISYVQGQSESIRRILFPLGIKIVFRPQSTLRKILSRPQDTIPTIMKSGIVYQISCQDYEVSYIGQTGRNLSQHITEHRRAVRKLDTLLQCCVRTCLPNRSLHQLR